MNPETDIQAESRPPARGRGSSRRRPAGKVWLPAAAVAVVGAGVYGWVVMRGADDAFPGLRALDLAAYTGRPFALRGETFTVRGTVDRTLASSPESADRIVVVTVSGDSPGSDEPLPLKVPAAWISRMQTGREMVFKVYVAEGGILLVQDIAET